MSEHSAFVATSDDGSRWVSEEDYNALFACAQDLEKRLKAASAPAVGGEDWKALRDAAVSAFCVLDAEEYPNIVHKLRLAFVGTGLVGYEDGTRPPPPRADAAADDVAALRDRMERLVQELRGHEARARDQYALSGSADGWESGKAHAYEYSAKRLTAAIASTQRKEG